MKKKIIAAIAVAFLLSTQISIVAIGRQGEGHTAIIYRDKSVGTLRFLDSTKAQCINFREISAFVTKYMCEGRLAIIIADRKLALIKLPFSQTIADITTTFWPNTRPTYLE